LKIFTWLDKEEIAALQDAVDNRPEKREAQRTLAQRVTRMIHGETAVAKAEKAAQVLFGGDLEGLDASDIADIFADVPSSELPKEKLGGEGMSVIDLVAESGLASSRGDAKRTIQGGGAYLNNVRISDLGQQVTINDAIDGQFIVLRKGRRKYHLVKLVG
jgi:tyrosyl-tRNA synthetase